jgi:hypothetical protein
MSSDYAFVLATMGLLSVDDALILYGAYLALSVWRGLVVPIYKSRAAWMALVGIPLVIAVSYSFIVESLVPTSFLGTQIIFEILFTFPLISMFVWIDRTINSVIRLDYLRRDILYWKRLRAVYWAAFILANAFFFSRYLFTDPYAYNTTSIIVVVALAYGSLCLARGARTTRDMTFRSHVKWFGFLAAAFVPAILAYVLSGGPNILSLVLLVAASYCFFRMARLLVPASKLELGLL